MRPTLIIAVLILLAGCELAPDEAEVSHNIDIDSLVEQGLANKVLIGTPNGEPILFSLTGIVTDEQEANPATSQARDALGNAILALGDSVESASDWTNAHRVVSAYLASPPENVTSLPEYALEQVAAHMMASKRSEEFLAPENVSSASVYAGFLADNAYPDPRPVSRFLAANSASLSASEQQRLATQSLAASEAYQTAIRDAEAKFVNCDSCLGSGINAAWTQADAGLTRVAAAE